MFIKISSVSEFRSHFLSELSHWKSRFQEVRVRRNKNLLDEVKNITGHVLKYSSKNWMKNLELLYLTSRSIKQYQPKDKQNNPKKNEKLKQSNKLNTTLRQNLIPLNIPISKIWSRPTIILKSVQHYICMTLKNSLALEDRLPQKWPKHWKMKSIAHFNEMLLKIVKLISSESFLFL